MNDLLQKGNTWLTDMRSAHMSKSVAYAPIAGGSVAIVAAIARTVFEVETEPGAGIFQKIESRDFIVATSLMASDPVRGDRIREALEGTNKVLVYEVLAPGGQPCWQWADGHRTARRIHTKHVGTETA